MRMPITHTDTHTDSPILGVGLASIGRLRLQVFRGGHEMITDAFPLSSIAIESVCHCCTGCTTPITVGRPRRVRALWQRGRPPLRGL